MMFRALITTIVMAVGFLPSTQSVCALERAEPTVCFLSGVAVDFTESRAAAREKVAAFADNNRLVLEQFDTLTGHVIGAYTAGEGFIHRDVIQILEAVKFSAMKHQGQYRINKSGAPYVIHPFRVADYALLVGGVRDPDVIIAALLHDTVEDTDATLKEIEELFGPRVAGFVEEVTDDRTLCRSERKQMQILNAPYKTAGAATVKLADKLDNLTDMYNDPITDWPKERTDEYFCWCDKVVKELPWVNAPLYKAFREIYDRYWERLGGTP